MSGIDVSILWPALIAGLLVTATHVPLGMQVLARGIVFIDLAIAQIAGCGVILADRLGFDAAGTSAQVAALLAAIAGALLLTWTERRWPDVQEAIIGVVFVLAATAGVLLLAGNVHGSEHLRDLLVGQILWVQPRQLLIAGAIYTAVLALWIGARARLGRTGFYLLFACVVTLSVQLVGLYLVFATLIVPPLATRHRVRLRLFSALLVGHGRLRQRHRVVGRARCSDGAAHRLGAGGCWDHLLCGGAECQGCAGGGAVTRYSRSRESSHTVTGPSLTSATCMFAPNTPVCTGCPIRVASICTNASKRGCAMSGGAAARPRRPIAFARRREQRELRDGEQRAARVEHRSVHHAGLVVEYPHVGDLSREPFAVVGRVVRGDADEKQQPRADPAHDAAIDDDARFAHALREDSHRRVFAVKSAITASGRPCARPGSAGRARRSMS